MKYEKHVVIVLKKSLLDKSVSLVTLFSKQGGKIETRIKGAQQITGKRLAALEVGSIAEVELYEIAPGKTVITSMVSLVALRHPHDLTFDAMKAIFVALESLLCMLPAHKAEEKIFMNTVDFLTLIAQIPSDKVIQLQSAFLLQILSHLGYVSKIECCSSCHIHLRTSREIFLHPFENRFLCDGCRKGQSYSSCSKDVVKVCLFLKEHSFDEIIKLMIPVELLMPVEYVVKQFIGNTVGRTLESFSL